MFLKRAEEAGDADQFDKIGNILSQMDGALFDVRQELALQMPSNNISSSDREQALITEEYEENT
jgi:hypothetical protein